MEENASETSETLLFSLSPVDCPPGLGGPLPRRLAARMKARPWRPTRQAPAATGHLRSFKAI